MPWQHSANAVGSIPTDMWWTTQLLKKPTHIGLILSFLSSLPADFDCILTTVDLERVDRSTLKLKPEEQSRINNILQRAMDLEKGVLGDKPNVDEDHPDGCK